MVTGRSDFGPREVLWLLQWLPEGCAFHASIAGGPEYLPWTLGNLLAAGQTNALNAANWQRGGGKSQRPKPIEPPKPKHQGRSKRGLRRPGGMGAALAARGAALAGAAPPAPDEAPEDPAP